MTTARANRGILCVIEDAKTKVALTIDVCKEETHTLNNTITDHPVEDGSNISDHVRPEPDTVTLTCFVSNTPLTQDQITRSVSFQGATFQTTSPSAQNDGIRSTTFDLLKKFRDEATPLKLVTTLKTYAAKSTEATVIQTLTVPRTAENYNGLAWSMTLKQIRIVKNKQTRDVKAKDHRAKPKKNQGNQTPKPEELKSAAFGSAETASQSNNAWVAGAGKFAMSGGQ